MGERKTLGDRIQFQRKAWGLSQEALGEKLGISRQAVSKWESDAAIPELENLIAMSRIFEISVGRLLGVEEEAGTLGDYEEASGLTDRELAAAEQIATKYAAETSGASKRSWTRGRKMGVGVVALAIALGMGLIWYAQIKTIERRLDNLQLQVNQLQQRPVAVYPPPDENDALLATCNLQLINFNAKDKCFTLAASATPLEWTEDTSVIFTATCSDGESACAKGIGREGVFATNAWVIPMEEHLELTATVTTNGVARTQVLETLYGCTPESFRLGASGNWQASNSLSGKRATFCMLDLNIGRYGNSFFNHSSALVRENKGLEIQTVELCIYRNGAAVPEQVLPVELRAVNEFGELALNTAEYRAAVEMEPGDSIVAAAKITDSWNQTSYIVLNALERGEKSAITSNPAYEQLINRPVEWIPGTVPENLPAENR